MFTTILHHITNTASCKLPLYNRKAATILKYNKNHSLFIQKSKGSFKAVT